MTKTKSRLKREAAPLDRHRNLNTVPLAVLVGKEGLEGLSEKIRANKGNYFLGATVSGVIRDLTLKPGSFSGVVEKE